MKMSELILAVGDDNVKFQNLLNDAASIDKTKHGTKITFYTDGIQAEEIALNGGSPSKTTREFHIWRLMLNRCHNELSSDFRKYGARGIQVCRAWRDDFMAFYNELGPRPSPNHSVDRINNDRGYEPGNCRWALPTVQANNTRATHIVTFRGERRALADWARHFGVRRRVLYYRLILAKWPVERAFENLTASVAEQ